MTGVIHGGGYDVAATLHAGWYQVFAATGYVWNVACIRFISVWVCQL